LGFGLEEEFKGVGVGGGRFVEFEDLEEGIELLVVCTVEQETALSGGGCTSAVSSRSSWIRNLDSLATTCEASFRMISRKWSERRIDSSLFA
jgi:hypothetical protein